MILFLDDNKDRIAFFREHAPSGHLVVHKKADECIERLSQKEEWNIVFLDHDLGPYGSGMDVVDWICQNQPFIKEIIVHSENRPAAEEMVKRLADAQYRASLVPFSILLRRLQDND